MPKDVSSQYCLVVGSNFDVLQGKDYKSKAYPLNGDIVQTSEWLVKKNTGDMAIKSFI